MENRNQVLNQGMEYDAFDVILEYLTAGGHVDTLEEALYVMLEMDEYTISDIMEEYYNYSLTEEINHWVNSLIYEGYDLSDYTWDEVAEYYLNETPQVDQGKSFADVRRARNARYGGPNPLSIPEIVAGQRQSLHRSRRGPSRKMKAIHRRLVDAGLISTGED